MSDECKITRWLVTSDTWKDSASIGVSATYTINGDECKAVRWITSSDTWKNTEDIGKSASYTIRDGSSEITMWDTKDDTWNSILKENTFKAFLLKSIDNKGYGVIGL